MNDVDAGGDESWAHYWTAHNSEEPETKAAGYEIPYSAIKLGTFVDSSAFAFEVFHVHAFQRIHFLLARKQSALTRY